MSGNLKMYVSIYMAYLEIFFMMTSIIEEFC